LSSYKPIQQKSVGKFNAESSEELDAGLFYLIDCYTFIRNRSFDLFVGAGLLYMFIKAPTTMGKKYVFKIHHAWQELVFGL